MQMNEQNQNQEMKKYQQMIKIEWKRDVYSIFKIENKNKLIQLNCYTLYKNDDYINTQISSEIMLKLSNLIKNGYSNNQITQYLKRETKLSDNYMKVINISENTINGGGGCGGKSYREVNEGAVVKSDISKAKLRNKKNQQSSMKADIQLLKQDMEKLINIQESDIHNGKTFLLDNILPIMNKFGVVANRVLHSDLLKLLMKSVNLLLKIGVQSQSNNGVKSNSNIKENNNEDNIEDENEEDEQQLIWTKSDKKAINDILDNILERINAKKNSEPLLSQIYCIQMIRDMLKLNKHAYKTIDEAVRYGIPLFGLIRNQDPTLILILAVEAIKYVQEQDTKNQMKQMIQFSATVMQNIRDLPKEIKNESQNLQLLYAYHTALDDVLGKNKNVEWNVQFFALMQINELIKNMLIQEEIIKTDNNNIWQSFFKDQQKGIFSLCLRKFSMSGIFLENYIDSYLSNHKMLRGVALEIVINSYKLIVQSESKSLINQKDNNKNSNEQTKQDIAQLLYQRWLFETSEQVRPLFLDVDILQCIDDLVQNKTGNQSEQRHTRNNNKIKNNDNNNNNMNNNHNNDVDLNDIIIEDYAKKEKEALQQIQKQIKSQGEKIKINKELENELSIMNNNLESLSSEDGIKKVIKMRQMELWKQSILNRRQQGEQQKDDALLETIDLYVNQRLEQLQLSNLEENEIQNQQERIDQQVDALQFIQNEFIQKKNEQNNKSPLLTIVANGGMGKSILLKKIEMELLDDFGKENDNSIYNRIPLVIKMAELDSIEPNIMEYLKNQPIFKEQRLDVEVLKNSSTLKLLLFDAFDEYKGQPFNLWECLNLSEWQNTKVIVTCRNEVLSKEDYNLYFSVSTFQQQQKQQKNPTTNQSFMLYKLIKFGKEQLLQFAKKYFEQESKNNKSHENQQQQDLDMYQQFNKIITENERILRLISLPINAFTFIRILPQLIKENKNTSIDDQGELQEIFLRYQFEREALMEEKAKTDQNILNLYIEQYFVLFQTIAIQLFKENSSSIDISNIQIKLIPQLKSILSQKQQNTLLSQLKNYHNPSIIIQNEEDYSSDSQLFTFTHKSLYEFFVARAMKFDLDQLEKNNQKLSDLTLEQIQEFAINSKYIMDKGTKNISVLRQFSRMIRPNIINNSFFQKINSQNDNLKDNHNYIQLILLTRRQYHGEKLDIAASNILSAICYNKVQLNGLKLSRCSIKKAYLYNYKGNIDVSGSNLKEAMLNQSFVDFSRSKIDNAQLQDAQNLWISESIYSYSSSILNINKKNQNSLQLITGSKEGYLNEFIINTQGKILKDQDENYIISGEKLYDLKKSKRLYTGKINHIKQYEDKYIISQSKNIIVLDNNNEEIHLFQAHDTEIVSIDINYSLKLLVTASKDFSIKIWNISKQFQIISSFEDAHIKAINCVQFSQNLNIFASASQDTTCKIWKMENNQYILKHTMNEFTHGVKCITFTPNQNNIITVQDMTNEIKLWNITETTTQAIITISTTFVKKLPMIIPFAQNVFYSPNGKYLVFLSNKEKLKIFDVENEYNQIESPNFHKNWITSASFSNNSKYLVSTSFDNSCAIFDVESNFQLISSIQGHQEKITFLTFSFDGQYIISTSGCYFYLWKNKKDDTNSNVMYDLISINSVPNNFIIRNLAFSNKYQQDKYQFAISTKDHLFYIYELEPLKNNKLNLIKQIESEDKQQIPLSLQFSQNDSFLITSNSKTCQLWNASNQFSIIRTFEQNQDNSQITSACFYSDNQKDFHLLLISYQNNIIDIYDISEISSIEKYKTLNTNSSVSLMKTSLSGKYLFTASSDNVCQVYDVSRDFTSLAIINCFKDSITNISFSRDSQFIAVSSKDKSIRVFSCISNFELTQTITSTDNNIENIDHIAFHPNNSKQLLASQDQSLVIQDLEKGYEIDQNLQGHTDTLINAKFSQDGYYLITSSRDCTLKLWYRQNINDQYIPNFELIDTIHLRQGQIKFRVNKIIFTNDNQNILGCCSDGKLRIWNIKQQILESGLVVEVEKQKELLYIDINPISQNYIISGNEEQSIIYTPINIDNKQKFTQLQVYKNITGYSIRSAQFSQNNVYLATGTSQGQVILWDAQENSNQKATFNQLHIFSHENNSSYITNICFTPDSKQIIIGYFDKLCLVIDSETRQCLQSIKDFSASVSSIDISLDGEILAISCYNNNFFVYQKNKNNNNKEIYELKLKNRQHTNIIYSISFCKKSSLFATCSMDKTCQLWSLLKNNNNNDLSIQNIQIL